MFNVLKKIRKFRENLKYYYYINKFLCKDRINEILKINSDEVNKNLDLNKIQQTERSLPGDKIFKENEYYKKMFIRYLFAMNYTKNKTVMDSCCGLGWGSYLTSLNASQIYAVDKDFFLLDFSKKKWCAENIFWLQEDVLSLGFKDSSFDTVIAMETIEHFSKDEAEKYFLEICRVLKKDGIIIGSSSFPKTFKEAEALCSTNPFHKHIYTEPEMLKFLSYFFDDYKIINQWIFVAKNKNN